MKQAKTQLRQVRDAELAAGCSLYVTGPASDGRLVFSVDQLRPERDLAKIRKCLKRAGYKYGSLRYHGSILRGWFKMEPSDA